MTNIFAILFFVLTQLIVEQQLTEKYCASKTNLKQPCPSCGSLHNIKSGKSYWGNLVLYTRLQCPIGKGLSLNHYYQIVSVTNFSRWIKDKKWSLTA